MDGSTAVPDSTEVVINSMKVAIVTVPVWY